MIRLGIIWSKRSAKSGRALQRALGAVTTNLDRCDAVLRWGSTAHPELSDTINTLAAVQGTVDKLAMLTTLKAAGVPIPKFCDLQAPQNNEYDFYESYTSSAGGSYVRGVDGAVRYVTITGTVDPMQDGTLRPDDVYLSAPVPYKRREYRVHVWCGEVIGLYEKIPHEATRPSLFKAANCKFKRCDKALSLCGPEAQAIAIRAVSALGLTYGAVDLIRTQNGRRYVVCEVNSSAGLNTKNVALIAQKVKGMLDV